MSATFSFFTREVVWCSFEPAPPSQPPEFIGRHPVVILSFKNEPKYPHLVVPLTSAKQNLPDATIVPIPKKFIPTNKDSFAICSHIYSVAHSRLSRPRQKMRITDDLFDDIKTACCLRLPFTPMEKP